jgi:hypothetical protein
VTLSALALIVVAQPAGAQEIMAYPTKGQSAEQQKQDRYECHVWASEQSGYDPTKGPPPAQAAPAAAPPPPAPAPQQPGVARTAARGAAVGAVGGAIAGDAGKGAAIGAASGALIGGMRRRDQRQQAAAAAEQRAAAPAPTAPAASGAADTYRRAMSACLQGRGYTVS